MFEISADEVVYKAKTSLMTCEVQGEIVILDPRSGKYFGLNRVAACVWKSLEGGATLGQLVETTVSHFDVGPETAEPDLRALIGELIGIGLVARCLQPPRAA